MTTATVHGVTMNATLARILADIELPQPIGDAAYDDELSAAIADTLASLAGDYAVGCKSDDPCSRLLPSGKHAVAHAVTTVSRNGRDIRVTDGAIGHTSMTYEAQAAIVARVARDRFARAESRAHEFAQRVARYTK